MKRGNLYAEQGQIGEKSRSVSLLFPGGLLEFDGDIGPRQMIILPDLSGRQNPAYRSTLLEVLVRGEASVPFGVGLPLTRPISKGPD